MAKSKRAAKRQQALLTELANGTQGVAGEVEEMQGVISKVAKDVQELKDMTEGHDETHKNLATRLKVLEDQHEAEQKAEEAVKGIQTSLGRMRARMKELKGLVGLK
jgi:septation ring formation regulator EzrA